MLETTLTLHATALETKLEIERVSMVFGGNGKTVPVLDRVSMEAKEGEFVCILGPSGCGKSTLLNIVGGFLQPTSGAVQIDGEPVRGPDPRRIFVFQEWSLPCVEEVTPSPPTPLPQGGEGRRRGRRGLTDAQAGNGRCRVRLPCHRCGVAGQPEHGEREDPALGSGGDEDRVMGFPGLTD